MIAPGKSGRPSLGLALGTRPQVFGVEFVKAGVRQSQFARGFRRGEFLAAMAGEEVTDEGSGAAFDQL
jgi:hypothetical protein